MSRSEIRDASFTYTLKTKLSRICGKEIPYVKMAMTGACPISKLGPDIIRTSA